MQDMIDHDSPGIAVLGDSMQDCTNSARITGWTAKLPLIFWSAFAEPSTTWNSALGSLARQNLLRSLPMGQSRLERVDPLLVRFGQALPLNLF